MAWSALAVCLCVHGAAIGQAGSRRILVLSSPESTQPATSAAIRGMINALYAVPGLQVELYSEYLDAQRIPSSDLWEWMARTIEEKYRGIAFDLVLAVGPDALQFVTRHRDRLRLTAPVVFTGIRHESPDPLSVPPFAAGLTSRFSVMRTVDLALALQPATRNLVVVAGSAPIDRAWERYARERLHSFEERLTISYLVGLPLERLLADVSRLPERSALLFLTVMEDGAGDRFLSGDVAARVAAAASAPVYGVYDTYLGRGLVGGHMDSFDAIGIQTAALAVRTLRGESPASIGVLESNSHAYMVDWRALRRWGLDEANLPPGADLRFREPSLWDAHRAQLLLIAGFLALQSLMIVALLLERQRRIRTQSSLRESEERTAVAAASADLGMWTWNFASGEIWTTDQCRALLGLVPGRRPSLKSLLGAIDLADRAAIRRIIGSAAASGTSFEAEVRRAGKASEAPRWLRVSGRIRREGSRHAGSMTGFVMDITARKQAAQEAEQQKQQLMHLMRVAELGELSGALAHEINQPLTAILSNAQAAQKILAREHVDIELIREIIDDIADEDSRAGLVVERMRSLIKKSKPHREAIDVNRLVGDVIDLMHSEFIERQVSAKIQSESTLPVVVGDPVQLQQVLINLIVNACEAMSQSEREVRHLLVSTGRSDGGFVSIAVIDRGPGIRQDMMRELFKPFLTTKSENLGLGLSICRWILAEHGGRLSANNNSAGQGATFTVELPIRAEVRHGT